MKRFIVYIMGLFIVACGVVLSTKGDLGVSAVSALPYALSFVWGVSFGVATVLTHIVYVASQVVILGKRFKPRYLLQIPFGIMLGGFLDILSTLFKFPTPSEYYIRLLLLCASILLIATGLFFVVVTHIVDSTAEGFIRSIAIRFNKDFSKVKLVHDITTATLALVIGLIFIQGTIIVREGTVVLALLVGPTLGVLLRRYGDKLSAKIKQS